MRMQCVALCGAALTMCTPAWAQSSWATHGEFGLVAAQGVTSTESGDLKFDAAHAIGRWTYSGGLAALYASTNHLTTQEDTDAHLQVDLALGKRTFWFGTGRWDRNLFSGFGYQESVASGLGRILIQSKTTQLTAELGVGYRRELPELLVTNSLGAVTSRTRLSTVEDAVAHGALQFQHAFSKSTKLTGKLLVESGSSDTMTTANLGLQVKMNDELALSIAGNVINNTNPPPGGSTRHTDTVMTINLVYDFKSSKTAPSTTGNPIFSSLNMP